MALKNRLEPALMEPFQPLLIHVGFSARTRRWFWRARLGGKTVANGAAFRTRKEALTAVAAWIVRTGFVPR